MITQNNIKLLSIRNYLIALIAFTLPLNKSLVPLLILLCLCIWLIEGNFKEKLQTFKKPLFIACISFYMLHVFGLIYTFNIKTGTFDLEQKLAFLIFPMLFFSVKLPAKDHTTVLKTFITGCILAGLICLANAAYKYYVSAETDSFFYSTFSAIMHSSYFAMYLNFGVALLLFNKEVLQNKRYKVIVILFFSGLIILLSSKSGILSLGLVLFCKIVSDIVIYKKYLRASMIIMVSGISIVMLYNFYPKLFVRLRQMHVSLTSNANEFDTTGSRVAIWKNAVSIISENLLFGVGTGDVKDALKNEYAQKGETKLLEKKLNAHNQYLQTFIALGLPGIFALTVIIGIILFYSLKSNQWDGAVFTLIVALNLLFESMLETQAGVIFIAFFAMFYLGNSIQKTMMKNTNIAA